jgi:hypothetical protein
VKVKVGVGVKRKEKKTKEKKRKEKKRKEYDLKWNEMKWNDMESFGAGETCKVFILQR